ncbi:MAG TPA: phage holin family protein [Steroidobacteraceae bacterium]
MASQFVPSARSISAVSVPHDAIESQTDGIESQTIVGLLRRLTDEITTLFRQEAALAASEFTRSFTKLLTGTVSIAAGGAVLFSALLVLLAAAVLGLATVLPAWLAALIIGIIVGAVGFVMIQVGRKSLDPDLIKPKRSSESLKRDKNVLTGSER